MLNITGISKSFGTRELFSNVNFTIGAIDRVALIGANGTGKTTMFDIIAGLTSPDSGTVSIRRGATMGYLHQQEYLPSNGTLLEEIASSCDVLNTLKEKISRLHNELAEENDAETTNILLKRLGETEQLFDIHGGYTADHLAKFILSGLGFTETDFERNPQEFSGGWRTRIQLGKLLYINPDILLLDEPTNYLDLETQRWFENYLKEYRGAVLFTSHDRVFLNNVADNIIAIEPPDVLFHRSDYDSYVTTRRKEIDILSATAKRQDASIDQQMLFIERFRAKATKARQVQSRIKQLEKIKRIYIPRASKKIDFDFPVPSRSGRMVIELKDISKSYLSHQVYQKLNLSLERDDKVAIVGANGAGKSTLLRIMAGVLPFESGTRTLGHNVQTAYFAQHVIETLNPSLTILEELRAVAPDEPEQRLRGLLGAFLFTGDDALKKIAVLSGGEKTRLAICKLLVRPANFILLDEPTNHLDIPSREVLADALNAYKGTLCLITHDRSLIADIATKIIEIDHGQAIIFNGNYEDYLNHKEATSNADVASASQAKSSKTDAPMSANTRRLLKAREGELRNQLYREVMPLNREIEEIEAENEAVASRIREIEAMMANPDHYESGENVVSSNFEYIELKKKLESLTARWDYLTETAEAIKEKYRLALEEMK